MKIAHANIAPDPGQPRKIFDVAELEVLAASILASGCIQPPTVRPRGEDTFWIVTGERRWRAHGLLIERGHKKFETLECNVNSPPNLVERRVRQVVENVARVDVTLMEEARSYADLIALELTPEQVHTRTGVQLARIKSRLSLLTLEPTIQRMVEADQLSKPQALEIARLPDFADQTRLVQMLNRGELGAWKSLKAAVDTILAGTTQTDMFGAAAPKATDADVAAVSAMERKIGQVSDLLAAGWKDGECIIAAKVSPDRAALMAEKLSAIRGAVRRMEQELRNVGAQAKLAMAS
jgi:ParB family transcriptional regulator, chromosome partitioning protein